MIGVKNGKERHQGGFGRSCSLESFSAYFSAHYYEWLDSVLRAGKSKSTKNYFASCWCVAAFSIARLLVPNFDQPSNIYLWRLQKCFNKMFLGFQKSHVTTPAKRASCPLA